MSSVTNLVVLMKELVNNFENYQNIVQSDFNPNTDNPENMYLSSGHPVIQKIVNEATTYLITDEGAPNWQNIDYLRDEGFGVGPGETDRYGWLTGVIYTKKGMIVFG